MDTIPLDYLHKPMIARDLGELNMFSTAYLCVLLFMHTYSYMLRDIGFLYVIFNFQGVIFNI